MVPVAKASLLSDLESQREQELAEAPAIQVGMLPHGSVQTVDTITCHEFQPFYEVGGGGRQGGVARWETLAGIQIDTVAALQ